MYKIKQKPEDFIVKEISNIELKEKGDFSVYLLKKRNYTTERAVQLVADRLGMKRKFIGYAGNKDRNAITEQLISVRIDKKIDLKLKDIELEFKGYLDEPISLGDLEGNDFIIVVRNIDDNDNINLKNKIKNKRILIPNYFGEQRFSKNNVEIGKLILKKRFKDAVELIVKEDIDLKDKIDDYLNKNKNDYIGALRLIPKKILKLYIHSFQSDIFNKTVDEIIKNKIKIEKIPVVGFGSEFEDKKIEEIILRLLKKETISQRDFIIREIPELSSEGTERDVFMEVKDFKITDVSSDKLNKNYKKIKLNFKLKKGSYATVVVDYLFQSLNA